MIQIILKDRLVHFLLLAAVLFGLHRLVAETPVADDPRVVVVDRAALEEFVAYRSRNFESGFPAEYLASLDDEALDLLIRDFVHEEVLYREALALGMDEGDYVIRRRLVQKVEFITQNLVQASLEISEDEARAFLEANRESYRLEPEITFTHVFYDHERHAEAEASALAEGALIELQRQQVAFSDAGSYGERFPYHLNYVDRSASTIVSHFGQGFAEQVFALAPGEAWHGPLRSNFGQHLVLISRITPARDPSFEELRDLVMQDAMVERRAQLLAEAIDGIVRGYDVRQTYLEERTP